MVALHVFSPGPLQNTLEIAFLFCYILNLQIAK